MPKAAGEPVAVPTEINLFVYSALVGLASVPLPEQMLVQGNLTAMGPAPIAEELFNGNVEPAGPLLDLGQGVRFCNS